MLSGLRTSFLRHFLHVDQFAFFCSRTRTALGPFRAELKASLIPLCWLLNGKAMSFHRFLKIFICLLAGFEGMAIGGAVPVHVSKPAPARDRAAMFNIGRSNFLPFAV